MTQPSHRAAQYCHPGPAMPRRLAADGRAAVTTVSLEPKAQSPQVPSRTWGFHFTSASTLLQS